MQWNQSGNISHDWNALQSCIAHIVVSTLFISHYDLKVTLYIIVYK